MTDHDPEQIPDLTPGAPVEEQAGEPTAWAGSRPSSPRTGDRAVDDALAAFDRAATGSAADQVEAAAEAHRALQARLTTPTPPPAAPGQARPGPRS